MHGFPLEYFSVENARVFSQPFGELLAVEDSFDGPERIKDCLRVHLQLNARNPITNDFWLERRDKGEDQSGHLDSTVFLRCVVHALALQTDGSSLELQLSTTGATPIVKLAQQPPSHLSNNMPQNI
ncbi:hypothetical protein FF1_030250 [Malus domestica]